jgi:hypothetical protein
VEPKLIIILYLFFQFGWLNPVARGYIRAWGAQVACRNSHSVVALRGVIKLSSIQYISVFLNTVHKAI